MQISCDDSEVFAAASTLAATAGACLSPKGEFAQEPERISRVREAENAACHRNCIRSLQVYGKKSFAFLFETFRLHLTFPAI